MSTIDNISTKLSETLTLTECRNPKRGDYGFWLWDETRSMNLGMHEKTERDALVAAIMYYQRRLRDVTLAHDSLRGRVDAFLVPFLDEHDRDNSQGLYGRDY